MKNMTAALIYGAKMHEADTGLGAGGTETGTAGTEGTQPEAQAQQSGQAQSFDEFLKVGDNQSTFDKRIAKAIETAKSGWEAEYQRKLEDARTEAEKLAKMTADQKAKYEIEKRDRELAERETALTRRELKATATGQLQERGLPVELADLLDYSNAESCSASIETIGTVFALALEKAVNDRLRGAGAARGAGAGGSTPGRKFTREEIAKMTPSEINANYEAIKASLKG